MEKNFTITAVVHLILLEDDKVLLLKRIKGWAEGCYGLVGGKVDGNETLTQAMIREAREEAGIFIKPEWLSVGCLVHTKVEGRIVPEVLDFFFICRQWENSIVNMEPLEHADLQFFPLNELPENIVAFTKVGIQETFKGNRLVDYGW